MEIQWAQTHFVLAAADSRQVPDAGLPQLVAAGHSNVGKSSLLNALLGRKQLVRTSKKPGCTRLINVFNVNERLQLVDLPGYGFAQAAKSEQRKWRKLIESYLCSLSHQHALVLMLLDARHGPKAADLQLIEWLNEHGIRWHPVATKIDKLNARDTARRKREMCQALGGMLTPLCTSSSKGTGMDALRRLIVEELL